MKRILPIIIAATVMLAGCGQPVTSTTVQDNEKINVVATIFPGYDFTREIAGDNVHLTMLLPPASESHSFEPTPKDIIAIQNSDVFIYVGGESDNWVEEILDSVDTSNMKVLSMMSMVDTVVEEYTEGMEHDHAHDEEEHDHAEDEHDHDKDEHAHDEDEHRFDLDEHVWTSPENAKKIVSAISDALCELDEKNAESYRTNTATYHEKLTQLDAAYREISENAVRRTLIFGDRFPFRYLLDAYGFDYYAAFPGCSTGTNASAKTIAFLIDKTKEEKIPVVFHIELSSEKTADIICESTGAKKLLLHTGHNLTKSEFEAGVSYYDLMTQNIANLKEALY